MAPNSITLLKALKAERDKGATQINCKPLPEIQRQCKLNDQELNTALRELIPLQALSAIVDNGVHHVVISEKGIQLLAAENPKKEWTLANRLSALAIVAAILGSLIAFLASRPK